MAEFDADAFADSLPGWDPEARAAFLASLDDDEAPEPKESPTRPPVGLRKELAEPGGKHKRPRTPSPRISGVDRQALFDELLREMHQ